MVSMIGPTQTLRGEEGGGGTSLTVWTTPHSPKLFTIGPTETDRGEDGGVLY